MRNIRSWLREMPKNIRVWFFILYVLISFYVFAVIYGQFAANYELLLPLSLSIAAVIVLFIVMLLLLYGVSHVHINSKVGEITRKKSTIVFCVCFFVTLAALLIWFIAYAPGGFSPDSISQYEQAITGQFNDWHPVIHTILFFWLPLKLTGGYIGSIVLFQILCFSLAYAYAMLVLYKNHSPYWFIVLAMLYICVSPANGNLLMFPFKDCGFSIFALLITAQLLQIYFTKGAWIKSVQNLIAFAVTLGLASLMRHNAVLFTIPAGIAALILSLKCTKRSLISLGVAVALVFCIKVPFYSILNVTKPGNRQVEMLGLPMTILCDIYVTQPEALTPEARDFMDGLATEEEWDNYYYLGNFNSIKWASSKDPGTQVEEAGIATILKYTAQAALNTPGSALMSVARLTDMVWCVDTTSINWANNMVYISNNTYGITLQGNPTLENMLNFYSNISIHLGIKYLFWFIGIILIILLVVSVGKISQLKLRGVLLILPLLIHNFGTMLLLSGNDFRFFHLSFVIFFPLLFALLRKENPYNDNMPKEIAHN